MKADRSWLEHFKDLANLPEAEQARLSAAAMRFAMPAGTVVFSPGKPAEAFILLLSGSVRVQQITESGREIVLFRVGSGDTCVMTTACLLAEDDYSAEGIAETDIEAITLSKSAFDDLMAHAPGFRRTILSTYTKRIGALMHVVEDVAFTRLDKRLAQRLLNRADAEGAVTSTHQDLAVELGTAREVIGRQLKEFAKHGWVSLTRGKVQILDPDALQDLADKEG